MHASIEKLTERINGQPNLSDEEKRELLRLLGKVVEEVDDDAPTEEIRPVQESVELTAGVEEQSIPEQLENSLLELEASYPETSSALGRIAQILARMGI